MSIEKGAGSSRSKRIEATGIEVVRPFPQPVVPMNGVDRDEDRLLGCQAEAAKFGPLDGLAHQKRCRRVKAQRFVHVGARVRQLPDGLEIEPGPRRPALLDSYADHRMVMAAAVLGLAIDGVEVADPGAVTKTLPDFRERWARLLGDPVGATR